MHTQYLITCKRHRIQAPLRTLQVMPCDLLVIAHEYAVIVGIGREKVDGDINNESRVYQSVEYEENAWGGEMRGKQI